MALVYVRFPIRLLLMLLHVLVTGATAECFFRTNFVLVTIARGRLYGIMFFQTYLYFTSGARDRTSLRALVAVLWTLDTLQLALLCHAAYYFLVLCNGHPDELAISIWSLNLEIAPSFRSFFTVRLWHHGVRASAARFQENKFSELPNYMVRRRPAFLGPPVWDPSGVILSVWAGSHDSANVGCSDRGPTHYGTVAVLSKKETNSLINRLIVWTVNTALLTGIVETAQVISWVSATRTLSSSFHLILAKLYMCSMLALLNGRRGLRETFDEPTQLPRHRSSIVISLHDDTGDVLNETGSLEDFRQAQPWKRFVHVRTDDLESVRGEREIRRVCSDVTAHSSSPSTVSVTMHNASVLDDTRCTGTERISREETLNGNAPGL
ncbi:hypothetical protein BJY52DRAFT_1231374 [Lactarius psammicola]|nr:hypothetical protein BJY52DRAFT_1231374 [Lactarius psammicola]